MGSMPIPVSYSVTTSTYPDFDIPLNEMLGQLTVIYMTVNITKDNLLSPVKIVQH